MEKDEVKKLVPLHIVRVLFLFENQEIVMAVRFGELICIIS